MTPKAQAATNWTSGKLNFCASKDTIIRVKRQALKWETVFANHISNK